MNIPFSSQLSCWWEGTTSAVQHRLCAASDNVLQSMYVFSITMAGEGQCGAVDVGSFTLNLCPECPPPPCPPPLPCLLGCLANCVYLCGQLEFGSVP